MEVKIVGQYATFFLGALKLHSLTYENKELRAGENVLLR